MERLRDLHVAFSVVGILLLYVIQRLQSSLPFNPTDMVTSRPRCRSIPPSAL